MLSVVKNFEKVEPAKVRAFCVFDSWLLAYSALCKCNGLHALAAALV